jgi:hypothetical protein
VLAEDLRPDNSGANARDRSGDTLTPIDQADSKEDLRITQSIRKAVVADEALSLNAQNVKVITQNGVVALRGPVQRGGARLDVLKAKSVAGVTRRQPARGRGPVGTTRRRSHHVNTAVFDRGLGDAGADRELAQDGGLRDGDISVLFPDRTGARSRARAAQQGAGRCRRRERGARSAAGSAGSGDRLARDSASARSSPRVRSWLRSAARRSAPRSAA